MTAWSRVLPPVEGGGPGCSAFRETAEHQRSARPWPPSAPLGRCGPCPAALPLPRASLPAWALGLRPAALARAPALRSGVAAAYRRAACARWRGAASPPAAPAAAWAGPSSGGLASPSAAAPGSGVARPALRAAAGSLRGCSPLVAPFVPAPHPRRAGSPSCRPLSGGPANAMGRRASSLRGAAGAGCARLRSAAAPRSKGYHIQAVQARVKTSGQRPPLPGHPVCGRWWVSPSKGA